jgi:hypothetical protein
VGGGRVTLPVGQASFGEEIYCIALHILERYTAWCHLESGPIV